MPDLSKSGILRLLVCIVIVGWSCEHPVYWKNTVILANLRDHTSRIVEEVVAIRTTKDTLNRDSGLSQSSMLFCFDCIQYCIIPLTSHFTLRFLTHSSCLSSSLHPSCLARSSHHFCYLNHVFSFFIFALMKVTVYSYQNVC